ncbi:MAG UNVERIFIED_CONTAM: D-Ala-D-Ala carboxypeptidase family metallohydrolase [Microcystis novacekii LVE1205-3]
MSSSTQTITFYTFTYGEIWPQSPKQASAATESSDQVRKVEVVREMPKILTPKDVDWSDMSTHLTPHFTLGENLRNDPRRIPHDTTLQNNILTIMRELEKIRTDYGKPIIITSGYCPEQINRAVGGVSNSQHIRGTAVDICPAHGDVFEFQKWVNQHWYGALGWGQKRASFILIVAMERDGKREAKKVSDGTIDAM